MSAILPLAFKNANARKCIERCLYDFAQNRTEGSEGFSSTGTRMQEFGRIGAPTGQAQHETITAVRLVLIDWIDSFGCSPNWEPLENPAPKPMHVQSVGWLAYDGKDCKVVIPHVSAKQSTGVPQQGCGDMTIPTRSILKIKRISPK